MLSSLGPDGHAWWVNPIYKYVCYPLSDPMATRGGANLRDRLLPAK